MTVTVDKIRSIPNDSIGSASGFVSPYLIDFITLGVVGYVVFGDLSNPIVKACGFILAAALAIWAALSAKALRLYMIDTPRSKVVSAAQGFVELQGSCEFYGNRETQGFLSGPPCVWHRYFIIKLGIGLRKNNIAGRGGLFPLQIGASEIPFVIRDETGVCIVNPKGAKVISSSQRSWAEFGKYFSSKYIAHGAKMYVIGELRADGCAITSYNENAEVGSLLTTWKKDQTWLLEEFDVDQNGELDPEEWQSAVKRAKALARDLYEQKGVERIENVIRKPGNGLPMLISDRHPDVLANKFARLGYFNVAVACFCIFAALYQFV